ncbi:MAG: thioredoxin family protein [Rhodobacter sp.]|nr:thioredoxin family protein [Rhodobacter sp.]
MTPLKWAAAACIALSMPVFAAEMGDDGLHKTDWMRDTFKDLAEDLDEANAEGKRLLIMVEQRGCIYCTKMHEEVFPREEVARFIGDNYFVIQMNLHGSTEVTDFDGETLEEREMARKWGLLFTPTMLFLPEEVEDGMTAQQAAVSIMPGAFGAGTTLDMLTWVAEKRYLDQEEEDFQRYHARRIQERNDGSFD